MKNWSYLGVFEFLKEIDEKVWKWKAKNNEYGHSIAGK